MSSSAHRKRHGHHQKRTTDFKKVYHPFMPLLLIVTGSLLVFSALSYGNGNHGRTDRLSGGQSSTNGPIQAKEVARAGTEPPVLAYATSISQQGLLNATNQRRTTANVGNLSINSKLNQAAQAKANDMATRNYWAHNTPEGSPPWTFISNAGYSYDKAGENLACGFDESSDVITGWYNSPSHRDNLLHPSYKDVGFGIANANNYNCGSIPASQQTIIVAMYGTPYTPTTTPSTSSTPSTKKTTTTKPSSVATPVQTAQPATETAIKHTITINVVDSAGKPAPGIKATLHSEPKTGVTDDKGNVVFNDVETGKHTVTLEIDGAKSETPIDLTGVGKEYKFSIVKPELTSNKTDINEDKEAPAAQPQSVSRLQTLTDSLSGVILFFLVIAVLMGIGYLVVKHSIAAHRYFVKGERYILTHKYVDLLVVLLAIALYFLTRSVASIL